MIDLRSDTVTRPGPEMLEAMVQAKVGDDVFGEDPTVQELESEVATLLGKEAGVFVPSGTMCNQMAVRIHTRPGDEAILEADAHIRHYEGGAAAGLSGVQLYTISAPRGILTPELVESGIRAGHEWDPLTKLVCLENTHNRAGGTVYPLDIINAIGGVAKDHDLRFHLDGARLWNACAATGISEATYAEAFDTVSVCLSKGLGAPIGSVLVGSKKMIHEARRARKAFGGGMRQVGVIAAAGLYAVRNHRTSLVQDHEKAAVLARGLSSFSAVNLDPADVETNIVMFDINDGRSALEVLGSLNESGVQMVPFGPVRIRATTHRDVSVSDIQEALDRAESVLN